MTPVEEGLVERFAQRFRVSTVAVVLIAVAAVNVVSLAWDGGALGHDEAAYALKARHWIEDTPETGWNLHRGIAMSAYGFVVMTVGGEETGLRLIGVVGMTVLVAATWILGARMGGRLVGPLAAVALAYSPTILRRSTEFLSDVPAAALLMVCMVVLWRQFGEKDRPGYGLLWLVPLALGAFYFRYQSILSLMLIAIALAVTYGPKLRQGWRPVVLTLALGLIGAIPHLAHASGETGSPLGILFFTADVAGRDFVGQGLVDFALLAGWPLAGLVGIPAIVFFVWWIGTAWHERSERDKALFLLIPAAGQVLVLGLVSHGEARFVFFPLALTLIGGATGAVFVVSGWRAQTRRIVTGSLFVILVGSIALSTFWVRASVEGRKLETEPVLLAARSASEMAGNESCGVMTSYGPQVTFYSECFTTQFRPQLEASESLSRLRGNERFLLLIGEGKRQPSGEDLDALVALTGGVVAGVRTEDGFAEIYRFEAD